MSLPPHEVSPTQFMARLDPSMIHRRREIARAYRNCKALYALCLANHWEQTALQVHNYLRHIRHSAKLAKGAIKN